MPSDRRKNNAPLSTFGLLLAVTATHGMAANRTSLPVTGNSAIPPIQDQRIGESMSRLAHRSGHCRKRHVQSRQNEVKKGATFEWLDPLRLVDEVHGNRVGPEATQDRREALL